ncbi:SDR family oxidoreductase [Parapusillimonas sp. SGNA-6]|uniref:SDR family oxidoreductase n=1 Tax=Parapedobacter sp. SGR-10 TaxID=2710879 RepID=UPI0013D18B86|nr:SDR family oxidoreductase [Parapedobacter sp. SGR-10]NGF57286.1 SDR family oxidoreductase [Parapedobacter sp. SGR-10]NGM89427.1 SDR family oxidoreductase [Parapusillimonas sp. SGNA-6]
MDINLLGKKALIGGSSSGIGRAIALQLAKCGAEVILMSRSEDKLKSTLLELDTSHGQDHGYLVTDFNNYHLHKKNITDFFARQGVDILINNTQGPTAGTVLSKGEEDYRQAFELLFQHAVYTTQLALPYMKEQGFGRIINVSSMTVKEPQDNLVLSNTMRTALVSWSKSLSNAVAKDGITVNSILTGYFETDRLNSLMDAQAKAEGRAFEEVRKQRMCAVPVQRLGQPEEYGYLVAFLASEYASFLTGAGIPLDGGISGTLF